MAARINRRHQEMVREKIRASQLVNRLENHVLDGLKLSSSQVSAALGLLKKVVPDLSAMDVNAIVNDKRSTDDYTDAELSELIASASGKGDTAEAPGAEGIH